MKEVIDKNTLSFSCSKKMLYLRTPKDIWNNLNKEFEFTCDMCASNENHLVDKYYTIDNSALDKANNIYFELKKNKIDAIIDDTDENFSSKIKKMNLIGAPYQIIIGKQTEGDLLEFKEVGEESQKLKLNEIIKLITEQKVKN